MESIPSNIIKAHSRAHKESMQPDACIPSSVAFTHWVNKETWVSGLSIKATTNEVKRGAEIVAKLHNEQVYFMEGTIKNILPTISFLESHQKIWILVFQELDGHLFSAIHDQRSLDNQFFVWDTFSKESNFSYLSTQSIIDRIVKYHKGPLPYYLFGFSG